MLASCGESETLLVLDLKTDLVPGLEFDRVETAVEDHADATDSRSAVTGDRFDEGLRIAEIEGIPSGDRTAVVTLTLRGEPVVDRRVSFRLRETRVLTVIISRDCRGVTCDSGGAAAQACLGGRCVDARCTPETPEFCSSEACESDAECSSDVSCAVPVCSDGACFSVGDDAQCGEGLYCNPDEGCLVDELRPGGCADGSTTEAFCAVEGVVRCTDGTLSVEEACPNRCVGPPPRCGSFLPSNIGTLLPFPDPGVTGELIVDGDGSDTLWRMNSDTGAIVTDADVVVRPAGEGLIAGIRFTAVPMPGARTESAGVLAVERLEVGEGYTLRAEGTRPLIVAANGSASIRGTIDVGGESGRAAGPGGFEGVGQGWQPGQGPGGGGAGSSFAGGGGGAFGGPGGRGTLDESAEGGDGGAPYGTVELVPLLGGSSGGATNSGSSAGGGGGGAIQITARDSILLEGRVGSPGNSGAVHGGGGAGGGILLEAPSIRLTALSFLTANGGGGAGIAFTITARGSLTSVSAPGSGDAGDGSDAWGVGGNMHGAGQAGGGGGGGRIRINTARGAGIRGTVFPTAESGLFTEGKIELN